MSPEELKKVYLRNDEISKEEIAYITEMVAKCKRAIEIIYLLPGAKEEAESDPEGFLKKYGLNDVDVEGLRYIYDDKVTETLKGLSEEEVLKKMPYQAFRYRQFTLNKLARRDKVFLSDNVSTNTKMKKWRERQIERSKGYSGPSFSANVQLIAAYELTDGCSVGCPFCGIGAENLKKVFTYDDENKKLFKDVIKMMHEVLGDAAGRGSMYLACEPLDNRDYEKFLEDFISEFGVLPQITTAVPLRDVDRMRALLKQLSEDKDGTHYRFSIKSIDEAKGVLEAFSPMELLRVELLPQFEEAPGFAGFANTGRERDKNESDIETKREQGKDSCAVECEQGKNVVGTICCVSGFVINFARKDVRLITPYPANDKYPDGEVVLAKMHFSDCNELKEIILSLIDKHMTNKIPVDAILKPYDYFKISSTEEMGEFLVSNYGYYQPFEGPFKGFGDVVKLLFEGKYTKSEIAKMLYITKKIDITQTYFCLSMLYKNGIIDEFGW